MSLLTGIDHLLIEAPAGCEEAARAFYGGVLGLPELCKPAALQKNGAARGLPCPTADSFTLVSPRTSSRAARATPPFAPVT